MVGITSMGKSAVVPANVTGVRHNFVSSRHDRSAKAILVTTARTSPARATRFEKLSLTKLLDAPVSTVASTHPPSTSIAAVMSPPCTLNGGFAGVGPMLRLSPSRSGFGGDVRRFPRHRNGSTLWLTLLLGHNPNRSRGVGLDSLDGSVRSYRSGRRPAARLLGRFLARSSSESRVLLASWFSPLGFHIESTRVA